MNILNFKIKHIVIGMISAIIVSIIALGSWFVTPEGHVSIVRKMGEATHYTTPGLNFKLPLLESPHEMEVRTRKLQLKLSAATMGKDANGNPALQMPSTVTIAMNWNIPVSEALNIYKQYGSLQAYEDRVLDPRVNRVTKAVIAHYSIEQIMADRTSVEAALQAAMLDAMTGLKANISDMSLANLAWNPKIAASVTKKQQAKLAAEEESFILQRQNLEAQRGVNTATATAEATRLNGDADAYAIRVRGDAEAAAIKAKGEALRQNPNLVALIHEERWNGVMPTTMLSSDPQLLMQVK